MMNFATGLAPGIIWLFFLLIMLSCPNFTFNIGVCIRPMTKPETKRQETKKKGSKGIAEMTKCDHKTCHDGSSDI